jgi:hypothetical protein
VEIGTGFFFDIRFIRGCGNSCFETAIDARRGAAQDGTGGRIPGELGVVRIFVRVGRGQSEDRVVHPVIANYPLLPEGRRERNNGK